MILIYFQNDHNILNFFERFFFYLQLSQLAHQMKTYMTMKIDLHLTLLQVSQDPAICLPMVPTTMNNETWATHISLMTSMKTSQTVYTPSNYLQGMSVSLRTINYHLMSNHHLTPLLSKITLASMEVKV